MIETMGMVTLYGASQEFPSLLLAHVGSPNYVAEATWDSPAGFVYGWRWDLGKTRSAFYSTIVAKKPTWVSWKHLPNVLGAIMNRDQPEETYQKGELSQDAWKVYQALDQAQQPLGTKELRLKAGFPTGKDHRAAYLKAVEELESHLWLAKVFSPDGEGDEMSHGLVAKLYSEAHQTATRLGQTEATRRLVENHLKSCVYIDTTAFAKHLRLPVGLVNDVIQGLEPVEGAKNCYAPKENL